MPVLVSTCRAQPRGPSRAGPRQRALPGTGGKGGGGPEDECSRRVAVAVVDSPEWADVDMMRNATSRAFVEFGSPFNGCVLWFS